LCRSVLAFKIELFNTKLTIYKFMKLYKDL